MQVESTKPRWLDDEKEIKSLLNWFYQRVIKNSSRQNAPFKKLKNNFFPHNESGEQSWHFLLSLSPHFLLIKKNAKKDYYDFDWSGAKITLPLHNFSTLCYWLELDDSSDLTQWQLAVDQLIQANQFSLCCDISRLKKTPLLFSAFSHAEVLKQLFLMAENANSKSTLRELSARFFWGDSKLLDSKADWLMQVFPDLQFIRSKLVVNFYLPENYSAVLWIENQDTYYQLIEQSVEVLRHTALLYSAGFKLSSNKVRRLEQVVLHQSVDSLGEQQVFIDWLMGQSTVDLKCYFWGDLDYAGLAIFKAIKNNFSQLELFKPGYQAMLEMIKNGFGHPLEHRDKDKQIDPMTTGCDYADLEVLPLIRLKKRFFDQEGVELDKLTQF
ncbi:Wadjet anti-phage system protein JetD domain-containing protein [Aliikangiella sp. IMCC44359]|uniref:Wadjet anti-phage system protein JetD domain-containing protein n=1 Tax=Aliikangiella sp. IMCC44359 TaxID=3459125 RepID=UPI00403B35F2